MLRVNQYRLYELGMKLHPLANLPDPALYRDYFLELFESRNELLSLRDELPLRVCKPTLDEAIRSIDIALPRDWQQAVSKLSDENAALPTDAVFRIADAIKNFEPVLAAELQALYSRA